MTTPTRDALVRRSAVALFLCAGLITIANQLLAAPAGDPDAVVIGFGLLSLLSGARRARRAPPRRAWWAKVAIAVWGMVLLVSTAGFGNTVASPKEPMAVVIFMMVILVWLGLTAGRGIATAFAPIAARGRRGPRRAPRLAGRVRRRRARDRRLHRGRRDHRVGHARAEPPGAAARRPWR